MSTKLIHGRHGIFRLNAGETIVSESMRLYGEWAENEIAILRRFIRKGGVVADVGAFIGTHTVALARIVGPQGQVHAFERRREALPVVRENIALNGLSQVTLHEADVGAGGASITLDELRLKRLNLVRLNVEGMQGAVIRGSVGTLRQLRPVVFAEYNAIEGAADIFAAMASHGYSLYGASYPAFNPCNFYLNSSSIFGENRGCAIIAVPNEKQDQYDLEGFLPINSIDDAAGLLLDRPQYPASAMQETGPGSAVLSAMGSAIEAVPHRPLHVVVPFYRNEQLVGVVHRALEEISGELAELDAHVFYYNDSPDYPALADALADPALRLDSAFPLEVIKNPANLGFVQTCNAAFNRAIAAGADVVLLNSDTRVFPGALREMVAVAKLDPMIGFVSPRSNNATISTLPHESQHKDVAPGQAYSDFVDISVHLPRFTFTPTAIGFAMWIRGELLSDLGGFDEIYGGGYNEENDLVLRANRCGYRAVLANHAFVWHQGESSFAETDTPRSERETENARRLHERYPEYPRLVERYVTSPGYRAESLLGALSPSGVAPRLAFDLSAFGAHHNGTIESGIKLLAAASSNWPDCYRIGAYMTREAWDYHEVARLAPRVERLDPTDPLAVSAAIVRIGQPYEPGSVQRMIDRAPVCGVFMLDTISYDCGYLSLDFDHDLWRFVYSSADIIFTNSRFTLDRICNRFELGPDVLTCVSRHSLDTRDYVQEREHSASNDDADESHIFVIGNHYAHKFVGPTAQTIAAAYPDRKLIAIGDPETCLPTANLEVHRAGLISDETFTQFYANASVVVFPSHYEGFGFPLLHALAHRKPVFVRDTSLNRELLSGIASAANVYLYRTTTELLELLREIPKWDPTRLADAEEQGWRRSSWEILHALERAIRSTSLRRIEQRLRTFELTFARHPAVLPPPPSPGQRVGYRVAALTDRLLTVPIVRWPATILFRIYKRLRADQ